MASFDWRTADPDSLCAQLRARRLPHEFDFVCVDADPAAVPVVAHLRRLGVWLRGEALVVAGDALITAVEMPDGRSALAVCRNREFARVVGVVDGPLRDPCSAAAVPALLRLGARPCRCQSKEHREDDDVMFAWRASQKPGVLDALTEAGGGGAADAFRRGAAMRRGAQGFSRGDGYFASRADWMEAYAREAAEMAPRGARRAAYACAIAADEAWGRRAPAVVLWLAVRCGMLD